MKYLIVLLLAFISCGHALAETVMPPCYTILNEKTRKISFLIASIHVGFEQNSKLGGDSLKAVNRANKVWFENAPTDSEAVKALYLAAPAKHMDILMFEFLEKVRVKYLALSGGKNVKIVEGVGILGLLGAIENLLINQKIEPGTLGVEHIMMKHHFTGSKIYGMDADGIFAKEILLTTLNDWQEYFDALVKLESCFSCDTKTIPSINEIASDIARGSLEATAKAQLLLASFINSSTRQDLFFTRRNVRFVDSIDKNMKADDGLVSVFVMGAAHLVGDYNVLDQLRARGYKVLTGYRTLAEIQL